MQTQINQHKHHAIIGAVLVFVAAVTVSSKAIMVKLAYAYPVDASTLIALRMAFSTPFFIGLAIWSGASATTPKMTRKDAYAIVGFVLDSFTAGGDGEETSTPRR